MLRLDQLQNDYYQTALGKFCLRPSATLPASLSWTTHSLGINPYSLLHHALQANTTVESWAITYDHLASLFNHASIDSLFIEAAIRLQADNPFNPA